MVNLKRTGPPESVVYVTDSYLSDQQPGRSDDMDNVKIPVAYTSLVDAVAALGSAKGTIVVDLPYSLADDLTIPADVHLVITPRGQVTVAATKTLTINGPLTNFATTPFAGSGTVAYGAAAKQMVLVPASLTGQSGKAIVVKSTEDGFEFGEAGTGGEDGEANIETKGFSIASPEAGGAAAVWIPAGATISEIRAFTEGGGSETVDINFEERAAGTPNTAGTEVLTTDLQAVHGGAVVSSGFANAALAAGCWLYMVIAAVANSPTRVHATVILTK